MSPDSKLDPRIIIYNIPVDYTVGEILRSFVELNLPDFSMEDAKVVSLYPAGEKKHRSCIVGIEPPARKALEPLSKLNIKWMSCRFSDHISVLQYFKCFKFGHKAKVCTGKLTCSRCALNHDSKTCKKNIDLRCSNCVSADSKIVNHDASDRVAVPTGIRSRIERKISSINYG